MDLSQPPVYSPDGRYWWDGTRWVPVGAPPPAPAGPAAPPPPPAPGPAAPRRRRTGCWIALLLVVLVVLGVCGGGALYLNSRFGAQAGSRAAAVRYAAVVAQGLPPVLSAYAAVNSNCQAVSTTCSVALNTQIAAIDKLTRDTAANPPPPCLAGFDAGLQSALRQQRAWARAALLAVNAGDEARLQAAVQQMSRAGSNLGNTNPAPIGNC